MHDSNPNIRGMIEIKKEEASSANENGYGIFWAINKFRGPRRIENLTSIQTWAIDMDSGSKEDMLEKISAGLPPTMVVETKRGYHVYWKAIDAKPQHWNNIVLDRLVPFYGADKNARDITRVLRVPGYFHMKDPSDPFLIKKVWEYKCEYSEKDMAFFFKDMSQPQRTEFKKMHSKITPIKNTDFWTAVWRLDQMAALSKLSGAQELNGDEISFKNNRDGTNQVYVNNKSTPSWIDVDFRIGSLSKGGPTVAQWIRWYGYSWKETISIMQKYFREELPWSKAK